MDKHQAIIVLGCPRSGTTLLRRLLDAHQDLCCPGETFLFRSCAGFLESEQISHGFEFGPLNALEGLGFDRADTLERLRGFATGFYSDLAKKAGKKHWVAKTTIDSFYLPTIETLFGGRAKFICITRHGLDVVCSMEEFTREIQSYIRELHQYLVEYPQPLEAFAHAWSDVTAEIIDFAARHKADSHMLSYEALAADPDGEMKKITDFLGLKPSKADSATVLGSKNVDGIGDWKSYKKTKVETGSIGRWKDLPPAAIERLAPLVNETLRAAGYDAIAIADDEDSRRRRELAMMMMKAKEL